LSRPAQRSASCCDVEIDVRILAVTATSAVACVRMRMSPWRCPIVSGPLVSGSVLATQRDDSKPCA